MHDLSFLRRSLAVLSALALVLGLGSFFLQTSNAALEATVQNVTAAPYNGGTVVTWEAVDGATSYDVSYGLYSVSEGMAASYDTTDNTVSSAPTYTLRNLTNGVKYYIAVKAVNGNEKSSAYSAEATVTPSSVYDALPGSDSDQALMTTSDTIAPTVESALALTSNLVKIEFSEDVTLPSILPELSFSVAQSDDTAVEITAEKAEYKVDYAGEANEQEHKNIVFVTLKENTLADTEYTVTVSAAVVDIAGNPIESGVTDFALFTGTDRTEIPAEERPLTGGTTPTTSPASSESENTTSLPPADTTAPENVTGLTVTSTPAEKNYWLDLTWKKSTSPDATDQKLYTQLNQGVFENPISLGKDTETYRTSGAPESEITYKITTLDAAGNESSGTITSIRLPKLASTGAPFALLAFGSSLLLSGLRRLRKK